MTAGLYATTLDPLVELAHLATFNEVVNALSAVGIFGVKASASAGLKIVLHGGNFSTPSGVTQIADTALVLTPSTTNYVYVTSGGIVAVTTAAPSGWPGPMTNGWRALYQLATNTSGITSGTNYLTGRGAKGAQGAQGPIGDAGDELWKQRKRIYSVNGGASPHLQAGAAVGFDDVANVGGGGAPIVWAFDVNNLPETLARAVSNAGTTTANASGGIRQTSSVYSVGGNGFDVQFRFGLNTTYGNGAHFRWFVGLYNVSGGAPSASADPSAMLNMFGVGADDGDQTVQLMHNDASGTATKAQLLSNDSPTVTFPARNVGTNRLYELHLTNAPGSSIVAYTFTEVEAGHVASGTISSDLPASSVFLGWMQYVNTGAGGGAVGIDFLQITGNSRY